MLVWKADTATMNPKIDPAIIAEAYDSIPRPRVRNMALSSATILLIISLVKPSMRLFVGAGASYRQSPA